MSRIVSLHFGKVRNGALLSNGLRILHTTDRISAFDCILPFTVPGKGEILQALSTWFFRNSEHIMRNHLVGCLSRTHVLVRDAAVFPLELVVRGRLTGSLWRLYEKTGPAGVFSEYGIHLPEGMRRNQPFPAPILTPTTKASFGHDLPATPDACVTALEAFFETHAAGEDAKALARATWETIGQKARALFSHGAQMARERGLVLVDTKYEMGWASGELVLVDEIHTPDSSRYWFAADAEADNPRQLSKEVLREELVALLGAPDAFGPDLALHPAFRDTVLVARLQEQIRARYQEMFAQFVPGRTPFEMCQDSLMPWPVNPKELEVMEDSLRLPAKVLIVGNGGRDHALFETFASKPEVARVYCAPGKRAWTSPKYAECPHGDVESIAAFADAEGVGLVVAGPELPIAQGLYRACRARNIPVLAPDLSGASLEASKILCKQIVHCADIRTAPSEVLSLSQLGARIETTLKSSETSSGPSPEGGISLPRVIKYDCLATGKGVFVAFTRADLANALASIHEQLPAWQNAARGVACETYSAQKREPHFLLEDCLFGEEISVLALCNGSDFRLLPFARDYKRRNDGQTGPNTGGMGAVCPVPLDEGVSEQVTTTFQKILLEMAKRGTPYRGFLFAGFMIDAEKKAWLIEFNCRLGDPETQVVLPGLGREFATELWRTAMGESFLWPEKTGTTFEHDGLARVFVVGAAPEYPDSSAPKRIFADAPEGDAVVDTCLVPSAIEPGSMTSGGRAFGILGVGRTVSQARARAYERMAGTVLLSPDTEGARIRTRPHYRTDVGAEFP